MWRVRGTVRPMYCTVWHCLRYRKEQGHGDKYKDGPRETVLCTVLHPREAGEEVKEAYGTRDERMTAVKWWQQRRFVPELRFHICETG